MKTGSKTHICGASRDKGAKVFGRLVNLYVQRNRRWVKVGTICSNCGYHWINGRACGAQLSNGRKAQQA
jgi:hypothetical protein